MGILKRLITAVEVTTVNSIRIVRAACVCVCMLAGQSNAQDAGLPSQEQMELLRTLPAAERERLLEQLGLDTVAPAEDAPDFPQLTQLREDPALTDVETDEQVTISGGETVVITIDRAPEVSLFDFNELSPPVAALIGTRAYQLTTRGDLQLPGVATVPLAGLNAKQIVLRLSAEPALELLAINAEILPLVRTGVGALGYFGYDLFDEVPTTFAPATDVPVPSDYVVGPGDEFKILLFGTENQRLNVFVSRDGNVALPDIGPVTVAGLTFPEARAAITDRIEAEYIGVRTSITLGELRSIRVFVLGDVSRPGSYVVSGLSTMTNALFLSGGVELSGSLRRVQLKRAGRVVGELDLYDLLLRGDTRGDRRLQPGDAIFVPPVGARVGIEGEFRRPAFYELKGATTVADAVRLAGGLTPLAFPPSGRVERVTARGDRSIVDANLASDADTSATLQDGDVLRVFPVLDRLDGAVELLGHVRRPAQYEFTEGIRLSDLIPSTSALKPQADLGYILIRREAGPDSRIELLSADIEAVLAARGSDVDTRLQPRDQVIVFELGPSRGARMDSILAEIDRQATNGNQVRKVSVGGQVQAVGEYPLEQGMRVSDLLRAGGGFTSAAYLDTAELTRFVVGEDGSRRTVLIDIDLQSILAGDTFADELLAPYDYLNVREIPEWREQEIVTLEGEVRFPGAYPIKRGESLASVVARAGGITDLAFVDGSVFTRQVLKEREEEQIEVLISRLEADLATLALQSAQLDPNTQQAFALGQSLLGQLRSTEATGRLVIDLAAVLIGQDGSGGVVDITLKDGDRLYVPPVTQEVTVIGEVQYATSHLFDADLDRDDYLSRSGGLTSKADAKRIYVVRANGQVVAASGTRWLRRAGGSDIRPGDTIVVPIDADRIAPLTLWSSVTQIVYNLAVAVAAVNSF